MDVLAKCTSTFGFSTPFHLSLNICTFTENRSWIYRKFITGGINRDDPDNPLDNKDHALSVFFRDHVARFVNKGWIKAIIILTFAGYLGCACYGLTQIKEGLERRKLSKSDSYSVKFFDLEDDFYREFPYRIQVIITGDLNYSDPSTQMQIEQAMQRLENTSYVTSSIYTESWLRTFLSFIDRSDYLNISVGTEQEFIEALKEVRSSFVGYDTMAQSRFLGHVFKCSLVMKSRRDCYTTPLTA